MIEAEPTFEDFYALYPRKIARVDALKAWTAMHATHRRLAIQHIPRHTAKWLAEGQDRNFIPYPATWLRGMRWEDEIEIQEKSSLNWRQSEQGTLEMARKVGINPAPAEDWESLRKRIAGKLVRAA